jgi:hypothetical protein
VGLSEEIKQEDEESTMTTELQQSEDGKVACGIRLSAEHRDRLRDLATTHGLAQGDVVETFLDTLDTPEIENLLKTRRLENRETGGGRGKGKGRKKSEHVTLQTFTILLNDLTPEQLITIAEAAWKLRGKTGSYEDARTPRRKKNPGPGRCSKLEVLEQARNLPSEQLQTLADRFAMSQAHLVSSVAPARPSITARTLIASLTGLLPAQLRTVAETAWKLKGRTEDFESCRSLHRQKRGFVGQQEVIEQFAGLNSEQRRTLADLIATFKAETN